MSAHTPDDLWGERQRRRVVRLCAAITRDGASAEDLAQETLLEAWRCRHKLHDPTGADRWLAAIARNVCLRWARARGQELPLALAEDAPDVEVELDRLELVELLDRALALLPPATRDVLVHRYVHDLPHAEIAALLSLSTDAVSMRLSRGKIALRRLLADEVAAQPCEVWQQTRAWCSLCADSRLEMRRDEQVVAVRCRGCGPEPTAVYDLRNPFFAELVGDLVRPGAILTRAAEWSASYFAPGAGEVDCLRCGAAAGLVRHDGDGRVGLHGVCRACGTEMWSSAHGIAQSQPAVRAFRRTHPRAAATSTWSVEHEGVAAEVVRFEPRARNAVADVVLARDTLRVLAVHA
jgi:RNA polymerase sigma factor (sigma-70 family)